MRSKLAKYLRMTRESAKTTCYYYDMDVDVAEDLQYDAWNIAEDMLYEAENAPDLTTWREYDHLTGLIAKALMMIETPFAVDTDGEWLMLEAKEA